MKNTISCKTKCQIIMNFIFCSNLKFKLRIPLVFCQRIQGEAVFQVRYRCRSICLLGYRLLFAFSLPLFMNENIKYQIHSTTTIKSIKLLMPNVSATAPAYNLHSDSFLPLAHCRLINIPDKPKEAIISKAFAIWVHVREVGLTTPIQPWPYCWPLNFTIGSPQ